MSGWAVHFFSLNFEFAYLYISTIKTGRMCSFRFVHCFIMREIVTVSVSGLVLATSLFSFTSYTS